MTQHCEKYFLWHYCQWMNALCIKIWKQRFCECVCKCINERVVSRVKEWQCPFVVIQSHFDLFGGFCNGQWGRWRGHCPELSIPETQNPVAVLRPSADLNVPWHRRRGHTQEPVLITSCFHDPVVTSWTQYGHAYHLRADVEALWVVRATTGLLFIMKGSEVIRQDKAGMCCVWVQCHRS